MKNGTKKIILFSLIFFLTQSNAKAIQVIKKPKAGGMSGAISSGQVAYGDTTNQITGNSKFFFDETNKVLSIGYESGNLVNYLGGGVLSLAGNTNNKDYGGGSLEMFRGVTALTPDGSTLGNLIFSIRENNSNLKEGVVIQARQSGSTSGNAGANLIIYTKPDGNPLQDTVYITSNGLTGFGDSTLPITEKVNIQGNLKIHTGRLLQYRSTVSIASADDITLGSGNTFGITGNATIKAINITKWYPGSVVYLIFYGSPTIKHNTVGGSGTVPIKLNGSIDFNASPDTILTLLFDGAYWQEVTRKIP
jgi:hypothetical protein